MVPFDSTLALVRFVKEGSEPFPTRSERLAPIAVNDQQEILQLQIATGAQQVCQWGAIPLQAQRAVLVQQQMSKRSKRAPGAASQEACCKTFVGLNERQLEDMTFC